MNAQAPGAIVTGTVIVVDIRILLALEASRQRPLEEARRCLIILRRSYLERKVGPAPPLAPLCFTPFKRKSMRKQRKQGHEEARTGSKGKQGHVSQCPTPGRRAGRCKKMQGQDARTCIARCKRCKDMHRNHRNPQHPVVELYHKSMILTRHPATDRSQPPPRAGGLLCMSFLSFWHVLSFFLSALAALGTAGNAVVPGCHGHIHQFSASDRHRRISREDSYAALRNSMRVKSILRRIFWKFRFCPSTACLTWKVNHAACLRSARHRTRLRLDWPVMQCPSYRFVLSLRPIASSARPIASVLSLRPIASVLSLRPTSYRFVLSLAIASCCGTGQT